MSVHVVTKAEISRKDNKQSAVNLYRVKYDFQVLLSVTQSKFVCVCIVAE